MKIVIAIHNEDKQNELVKDKPIYVGFAIVELSKVQMYET